MTFKQIAEAFSSGNFEQTYPFLSDNIEWNVIGEFHSMGKQAVMEKCEETAAYFKSVTTDFKTLQVIVDNNTVAINGTAAFIRDKKTVAFVSSCDVYVFDKEGKLDNVTSYCIQENKQ